MVKMSAAKLLSLQKCDKELSKQVLKDFQCQYVAKLWAFKVNSQNLSGSLRRIKLK